MKISMTHTRRQADSAGFSLVELLVVIAITGVLTALLLPSLGKARAQARIVICSSQMSQHGKLVSQYVADSKGVLPMPNSPHDMGSRTLSWLGNNDITSLTVGGAGNACPENPGANPRSLPISLGTAYHMGYLPPIFTRGPVNTYAHRSKLTLMDCPDSPNYRSYSVSMAQWNENQYRAFSLISTAMASGNLATGVNPYGANWDCQPTGHTAYRYRGWLRHDGAAYQAKKVAKRPEDWTSGHVMFAENEYYDYDTVNFPEGREMDVHGDGSNLLFQDGHASFGAKNIGGLRPTEYFSMTYSNTTRAQAQSSTSNYAYNAQGNPLTTANLKLFDYYEGR